MDAITLIVCGGVIFFFVTQVIPSMTRRNNCGAARIKCVGNLKQIGLAFRIFANEHDNQLPFQTPGLTLYPSEGNGGNPTIYQNTTNLQTWQVFQAMSNELASPKVLVCRGDNRWIGSKADHFRQDSTNAVPYSSSGTRNAATSYFIGLNADEKRPTAILAGDRNISVRDKRYRLEPGLTQFDVSTEPKGRQWLHPKNGFHRDGNLVFADGSSSLNTTEQLRTHISNIKQTYGTNALLFLFPNEIPSP